MDWQESDFHKTADETLDALFEALEDQDADGVLDIDFEHGVLSIEVENKTYIISKHGPSRQIWLSSPLSGGLHFAARPTGGWALPDGRQLRVVLAEELEQLTNQPYEL